MEFDEFPDFGRDFKFLVKKYRSLDDDLGVLKKVLQVNPEERPPFSFRIKVAGGQHYIIKVKKIACRSLKGRGVNSGLRLIYAWYPVIRRIIFIELYHKSEKESEDVDRIKRLVKGN